MINFYSIIAKKKIWDERNTIVENKQENMNIMFILCVSFM